MSILQQYEPKEVLRYFEEICAIPHGSFNLDKISDYLTEFAKRRSLKFIQDEKKNVIIFKNGQGICKDNDPVIIQGHMDMVAVKTADCRKDLEKEGLDLEVTKDGFLKAKGTSLGADDGIAVAYALALLDSDTIPHPPLEVVITTNEEVGMLGADYIDVSMLKGQILLNIDSEDEGIFTVSCAGGEANICHIPGLRKKIAGSLINIKIDGLIGGHSGVDINQGRLNAISALGRILNAIKDRYAIVSIEGGEKDNAIARFAGASIVADKVDNEHIIDDILKISQLIKEEYATVETDIDINVKACDENKEYEAFDYDDSNKIAATLICLPNGVIRMNPDIEDMVQTSVNLGILSANKDEVTVTALLRSSNDSEKTYLSERIQALVSFAGGYVEKEGIYPGWAYNPESKIRDVMELVYKKQYGQKPVSQGIHAGLECGLFAAKINGLDCISFGPRIDDIHTTKEKLDIESVSRTWNLIKDTLVELGKH